MYFERMAEAIEMPFGMLGRVGPSNHVLDGVSDPSTVIDKFWEWVMGQCRVTYIGRLQHRRHGFSQITLEGFVNIVFGFAKQMVT